jgi:phosphatidate cytidylyltransferase
VLKQRIITAIFLIAILFAALYILPIEYFSSVVGVFVLLAAWEWTALCGMKNSLLRIAYLLFLSLLYLSINQLPLLDVLTMMSGMAVFWWMWSIVWLIRFQRQVKSFERNTWVFGLIGLLVLLPFWFAVVMLNLAPKLNPQAGQLLLFVVLLVALSDTSAYFVGKRFGTLKLASRISPGKSWEGLLGAVFCVSLCVLPLAQVLQVQIFSRLELMGIGLIIVIAGVVGDLFESLVKRLAGVKDSGKILPGHGGILDRIDAYTAALPIMMAIYYFLMQQTL